MQIQAYRTKLVQPSDDITQVIAEALPTLPEKSIVVIASKIFSTCENCFVPKKIGTQAEKHELVKKEAEFYLDPTSSKYNVMLTVKRNWMFANAGIDESNANDHYILWPSDPQKSVNQVWNFLRTHYGVKEVGVTMSDSNSIPLNWGVTGLAIAYCGLNPLRSYIGKPDLFGRKMQMEQVNIAQSVTAIASVEMGEGDEQTPIAVVSQISNVEFQDHEPTAEELAHQKIDLADDVFAPILTVADWKKEAQRDKSMLSVSTKTGDKGKTGLANGQRLDKDSLIFEVLGTLDELNSWVGEVIAQTQVGFKDEKETLFGLQDTLFVAGAVIAGSPKVTFSDEHLKNIERKSDNLQKRMEKNWTTQFVYPGGTPLAAKLDLTRTVCRRLERLLVRLHKETPQPPSVLKFINRLSDYFFVLRCWVNTQSSHSERKFAYAKKLSESLKSPTKDSATR